MHRYSQNSLYWLGHALGWSQDADCNLIRATRRWWRLGPGCLDRIYTGFYGILVELFMGFMGFFGFYGILWDFMGFMGFYGVLWDFYGIL